MNSDQKKPALSTAPVPDQAPKKKAKDLNLKDIKKQISKFTKTESKHAVFVALVAVLLFYVFMVWRISSLATAEPSSDDAAIAQTNIPKIDKRAVNQIQALEQNNTQVHSLFNQARNNPFQE